MRSVRYWVIILLLTATALVLNLRSDVDRIPPSAPLSRLPQSIGEWGGRDLVIDPAAIAVLGKGDFLSRLYAGPAGTMPVTLFIGYFPTQRTGQTIHSPKHCLPGAGWTFESSHYQAIQDVNGKPYQVGEYVVSNGDQRQFVIYWYEAHGRSIANEYVAKAHLALDAIRMNRTDGALVRVMTPIGRDESVTQAQDRATQFTSHLAPMLSSFIPN